MAAIAPRVIPSRVHSQICKPKDYEGDKKLSSWAIFFIREYSFLPEAIQLISLYALLFIAE